MQMSRLCVFLGTLMFCALTGETLQVMKNQCTKTRMSLQGTIYAKNSSNYVALLFNEYGTYGAAADGSTVKINADNWARASVALQSAPNEALCFHARGVYRVDTKPTEEGPKNCPSFPKVFDSVWLYARGVVRPAKDPDSMVILHDHGVFKMNIASGEHTKLSGHGWATARAVVYDPAMEDHAVVFTQNGIYRFKLSDGSYAKLNSETWGRLRSAVYDQSSGKIVVIHEWGLYTVDTTDGSYIHTTSDRWLADTQAAVTSSEGQILIFHREGTFSMSLSSPIPQKVNTQTWNKLKAMSPMGPNAHASSWVEELNVDDKAGIAAGVALGLVF